jgi:hypothetical protein
MSVEHELKCPHCGEALGDVSRSAGLDRDPFRGLFVPCPGCAKRVYLKRHIVTRRPARSILIVAPRQ